MGCVVIKNSRIGFTLLFLSAMSPLWHRIYVYWHEFRLTVVPGITDNVWQCQWLQKTEA